MFEMLHLDTPAARIVPPPKSLVRRNSQPLQVVAYAENAGIGMGCLSDGSVYLTQRGLAKLCGVQNAHIGTISRDWLSDKPRIVAIRARLERNGPVSRKFAHRELTWAGHRQYGYDADVCLAVLDYYALDAGDHIQPEAQANRLRFLREDLTAHVLRQFAPPAEAEPATRPEPLRFVPLQRPESETHQAMDALIVYVCSLLAMSVWLANSYLDGLKQRAMNASWNRLGLHLPLRAILEIQAEAVLLINGSFTAR